MLDLPRQFSAQNFNLRYSRPLLKRTSRGKSMRLCTRNVVWVVACSSILVLLAHGSAGQETCTDIPPGDYSCKEQADFGKCERDWMVGFCDKSCGRCKEEDSTSSTTSTTSSSASASSSGDCVDILPPNSDYSCKEQAAFGKCTAGWMVAGNYCALSCKLCVPSDDKAANGSTDTASKEAAPKAETVATPPEKKTVTSTASDTTASVFPEEPLVAPADESEAAAPVPEAEQYRDQLTEAATELGLANVNDELAVRPVVLPGINLSDTPTPTSTPSETPPAVITLPPTDTTTPPATTATTPRTKKPSAKESTKKEPSTSTDAKPKNETRAPTKKAAANDCDPSGPTAYDVLRKTKDLSTLRQAIEILNLAQVMQNPNVTFTLFAPTNKAFNRAAVSLGLTTNQLLGSRNVLRDIIFTHIVPNQILTSDDVASASVLRPEAATTIFVEDGFGGLTLVSVGSSAIVEDPDFASGCNYVIHKIDNVLQPNPSPSAGINPAYQRALTRGPAGR